MCIGNADHEDNTQGWYASCMGGRKGYFNCLLKGAYFYFLTPYLDVISTLGTLGGVLLFRKF